MLTFPEEKPGLFSNPEAGWQPVVQWLLHGVANGKAAVLLFFVISGMVLSIQLERDRRPPLSSAMSFYIRRAFRILPLVGASILVAWPVALYWGVPANVNSATVWRSILLQDTSLNPPLWTIIVELWCSAAFPLLYYISRHVGITLNLCILAALSCWAWSPTAPNLLTNYLVFFHAGILVGRFGGLVKCRASIASTAFWIAFLIYGFLPQLYVFSFADSPHFYFVWTLGEIPACIVILWSATFYGDTILHRALIWPPMLYLGRISFSLYVFHFLIVEILYYPFYFNLNPWLQIENHLVLRLGLFLCVTAASVLFASLTYVAVEAPSNRAGTYLSRLLVKPVTRASRLESRPVPVTYHPSARNQTNRERR